MRFLIYTYTSFLTGVMLVFWQAVGTPSIETYKDIGMGGAFIITCIFGFKYFTKQVESKDKEIVRLVEKFISTIDKGNQANTEHSNAIKEVVERFVDSHIKLENNQKRLESNQQKMLEILSRSKR